jgi:hypothetical protein
MERHIRNGKLFRRYIYYESALYEVEILFNAAVSPSTQFNNIYLTAIGFSPLET